MEPTKQEPSNAHLLDRLAEITLRLAGILESLERRAVTVVGVERQVTERVVGKLEEAANLVDAVAHEVIPAAVVTSR